MEIDLTDHEERYSENEVCGACGSAQDVFVDWCPRNVDLYNDRSQCSCCEKCRTECSLSA